MDWSQSRREALGAIGAGVAGLATGATRPGNRPTARPQNFIIILCDNLGYGDIGCFGSRKHRTPHTDRMARQGMRLTSFYATSGVCTPSRASLMTGCYPRRVNLHVDENGRCVLFPVARKGLHPEEVTIAEVLKSRGYATACVGKWHLGDQAPFLPTRQGFDCYFGIPYSEDMTERKDRGVPPLPLMRDEKVVEAPADRNTLTKRYTAETIQFVEANRRRPFFIYLAHAMPGSTRAPFASAAFRGKSANGPWGDAVEELDWSTGQVLSALERLGLGGHTLVIWTSDNGAPRRNPPQGSNAPLKGWGYTTAEGGMRVPCVAWWPGVIPAGRACDEVCTTMDLLPTFTRLAGASPPRERAIDGKDIWPLLSGEPGARSPHEALFYYSRGQLHAVRSGRWKLYLPLARKMTSFGWERRGAQAELYDLEADLGERTNLVDKRPDVVARLTALAEKARAELGDVGRPGGGQRPAGLVQNPRPQLLEAT